MSEFNHESADDSTNPDAESLVSECVAAGREAMTEIGDDDQSEADRLTKAAAWAV
jgi:hypothetical protein